MANQNNIVNTTLTMANPTPAQIIYPQKESFDSSINL